MFGDIRKFVSLYDCSLLTNKYLEDKPLDLTETNTEVHNYYIEPSVCLTASY